MDKPQGQTDDGVLLLLQIRDIDDPMREQEVACFGTAIEGNWRLTTHSLLDGAPSEQQLREARAVLIGGSGDYSVVTGGPWLEEALEAMRMLVEWGTPTFASCWGFQAMARALGGVVVTSEAHAELGTVELELTEAGRRHPLTSALPPKFMACMGHHDMVVELPQQAQLLASSRKVKNQAFAIPGKPIIATQFHPELQRSELVQRIEAYPQYLAAATGETVESFQARCVETPEANQLIGRFLEALQRAESGGIFMQ